jgi:proline iminopeptidase
MGSPYPDTEGFVRVNGHRIFFRSLGRALRGTMLVVHGGPSDHRYLTCLADLVPHGFRIVWFDQWGCGRSDRPRSLRTFTMERAGAEVIGVARQLRLRSPHLFGHSWGGALALQAATRSPRRFRSVIVCGGFASDRSFQRAMRRHIHALPPPLRDPIERGEREGRYDDPVYRAAVRRRRREYSLGMEVLPFDLAVTEPSMNHQLLRAIYGDRPGLFSPATGALQGWDIRPAVARLPVPCLVLAGEREAGRYTALELHRLIAGSRLVLLSGAAHLPFLQSRDQFMQVVLSFLEKEGHKPPRRG